MHIFQLTKLINDLTHFFLPFGGKKSVKCFMILIFIGAIETIKQMNRKWIFRSKMRVFTSSGCCSFPSGPTYNASGFYFISCLK